MSKKPQEGVREAILRESKLGDESTRSNPLSSHDERRALLDALRPESKDQNHDHGKDVDRNGQELSIGGVVAESLNDAENCRRDSISADCIGPEHDPRAPDRPFLERGDDVSNDYLIGVGDSASTRPRLERQ